EDEIRIATRMIGMEMGHKSHLEIAGFDCRYTALEGSGFGAAYDARSEIDKVSPIINSDNGGRATAVRIRHRRARAKKYNPRSYRSLRRCLTRMPSRSTAQRQHQNSEKRPKNNTHEDHDASNPISLSSLTGTSEACR